jgi:hypothetical protein
MGILIEAVPEIISTLNASFMPLMLPPPLGFVTDGSKAVLPEALEVSDEPEFSVAAD